MGGKNVLSRVVLWPQHAWYDTCIHTPTHAHAYSHTRACAHTPQFTNKQRLDCVYLDVVSVIFLLPRCSFSFLDMFTVPIKFKILVIFKKIFPAWYLLGFWLHIYWLAWCFPTASWHFVDLCMCTRVYMHTHMCASAWTCVCVCVFVHVVDRRWSALSSSIILRLIWGNRISYWTQLASKPQRPGSLCVPRAGILEESHCTQLSMWVLVWLQFPGCITSSIPAELSPDLFLASHFELFRLVCLQVQGSFLLAGVVSVWLQAAAAPCGWGRLIIQSVKAMQPCATEDSCWNSAHTKLWAYLWYCENLFKLSCTVLECELCRQQWCVTVSVCLVLCHLDIS